MPYILLLTGMIVGILSMSAGVPAVPILASAILVVAYVKMKAKYLYATWAIPAIFGLLLGFVKGYVFLGDQFFLGEVCEGYIVKGYRLNLSVKADKCSVGVANRGSFFVSCQKSCPEVYDRAEFIVSSTKRFGKFSGKGKLIQSKKVVVSSSTELYYRPLRWGKNVKLGYYDWLHKMLPDKQAALVTSMLFGDTEIPVELSNQMKSLGILHVVAISGINISYLQGMVKIFLRRLRRFWREFWEIVIIILLFFIVGVAISLIRAIIITIWGIFAKRLGIMASIWSFLVGFIFILIIDPNYLWDAGFLLVSGACMGVYVGGNIIRKYIKIYILRETIGSIVIWLCVSPVQYFIFGEIVPSSIVVGMAISQLVEIVTILGYLFSLLRYAPIVSQLGSIVLGVLSSLILLVMNLFHVSQV